MAESELAILSRVIGPENPEIPSPLARMILKWQFPESDRRRMHDLLDKAKRGALSDAEKEQANRYERVGHLISILKSKSRQSLKPRRLSS